MSHTPAPWNIETVDEVGYSIHGQPVELTGIKAGIHTRIGTVSHVFEGVAPNAGWQPIPEEMNLANARLIAAAPTGLAVAESTYLALLKMSHDSLWRTFNQKVYCDLRDFIADATGRDGEEVQNEFEQRAMEGL